MDDLRANVSPAAISARFHNGVAGMVCEVVKELSNSTNITQVLLSGGVWQNVTLLMKSLALLREAGLEVYIHNKVPTNDGGLALGQAAIAGYRLQASPRIPVPPGPVGSLPN